MLINWWVVGPTVTSIALAGACAFLISDLGKVRAERDIAQRAVVEASSTCDAVRLQDAQAEYQSRVASADYIATTAALCTENGSQSFKRGSEIGYAACRAEMGQ